jgi:hypothetical protein
MQFEYSNDEGLSYRPSESQVSEQPVTANLRSGYGTAIFNQD